MKVTFGTFTRSMLESRLGMDVEQGVRLAVLHYARRLESGSPPAEYPRFLEETVVNGTGLEVDLTLEPELARVLEQESRKQGVEVDKLVRHAVLVYLADLDDGS